MSTFRPGEVIKTFTTKKGKQATLPSAQDQGKKQVMTACACIHKNGEILIVKRAKTKKFLPDKYELPGGHVEFGESMQTALQREIQEELHMEIVVDKPCYVFTYVRDTNIHAIEVDFLATLKTPDSRISLNPHDHQEYRWIDEKEVGSYFQPDDPEGRAVIEAFRLL